jgi:hypothetical protein
MNIVMVTLVTYIYIYTSILSVVKFNRLIFWKVCINFV